ncbi:hypothetical protein DRO_0146 [Deinococcus radiodurans R1 = ATCC 13939 = DSM 20539]|nr:hypothetical protein DRO_0146 [Deinococcus radiodurans R1 = ATCC 13939 = DSM 20539]
MGSANGVLDSKILIALCNDHKTARTIVVCRKDKIFPGITLTMIFEIICDISM